MVSFPPLIQVENVDGLSAKDLLRGHITHAKRVRLRYPASFVIAPDLIFFVIKFNSICNVRVCTM